MSIPKVIHYCWFGGNPLPPLAQKCIASWKEYCPDYEIIEWNETNFDLNFNAYVTGSVSGAKMGVYYRCCTSVCIVSLWWNLYGYRC